MKFGFFNALSDMIYELAYLRYVREPVCRAVISFSHPYYFRILEIGPGNFFTELQLKGSRFIV
jgi:hypothetical protein